MSTNYAHPESLVSTEWLAEHLNDANIRIVESNEDILLYDTGHIPGAVKIDWTTDLNDPVVRDYIDRERLQKLLRSKGINDDTTIVLYGDKNNWWATYALWVLKLFGMQDVKILDASMQHEEIVTVLVDAFNTLAGTHLASAEEVTAWGKDHLASLPDFPPVPTKAAAPAPSGIR